MNIYGIILHGKRDSTVRLTILFTCYLLISWYYNCLHVVTPFICPVIIKMAKKHLLRTKFPQFYLTLNFAIQEFSETTCWLTQSLLPNKWGSYLWCHTTTHVAGKLPMMSQHCFLILLLWNYFYLLYLIFFTILI